MLLRLIEEGGKMNAHKVPTTYYKGWKADGYKNSFYIFYKDNIDKDGVLKSYKKSDKITKEHSYFMEKDFYIIDFTIEGIEYKLKNEITEFLELSGYKINCPDNLSEEESPEKVNIDSYDDFMYYYEDINLWCISDSTGGKVSVDTFIKKLNNNIFTKVGEIIEHDYFACYLEPKWNNVKKSLQEDINLLKSNDNIIISNKKDFLEFVVVQYFRLDKRMEDIKLALKSVESIFQSIGISEKDLKRNNLTSPKVYFYGLLLDAARGNKKKILSQMDKLDKNYSIDILEAPTGFYYLTSTNKLVISKKIDDKIEEMLFPVNNRLCARFKIKKFPGECGKYDKQIKSEVLRINRIIIKESEKIVMSNQKNIVSML